MNKDKKHWTEDDDYLETPTGFWWIVVIFGLPWLIGLGTIMALILDNLF